MYEIQNVILCSIINTELFVPQKRQLKCQLFVKYDVTFMIISETNIY